MAQKVKTSTLTSLNSESRNIPQKSVKRSMSVKKIKPVKNHLSETVTSPPPKPKFRGTPHRPLHSVPVIEALAKGQEPIQSVLKSHKVLKRETDHQKAESWGALLKNKSGKSQFNSFDPLRTLHFLVRELQNKITTQQYGDKHLEQMVYDMLSALSRIPPEIASTIHLLGDENLASSRGRKKLVRSRSASRADRNEKDIQFIKKNIAEKSVQVGPNLKMNVLQKEMESSTSKLEESFKQLEIYCETLKAEKQEVEQKLKIERETVMFLKKQIKDLEKDREINNARVKQLEEDRDDLNNQVAKLTTIIDAQTAPSAVELKKLIQQLRDDKSNVDKDCIALQKKLTMMEMEKEKVQAMLTVRENQITEIRNEMQQLQDIVTEQLMEFQNNGITSTCDSSTTLQTAFEDNKPEGKSLTAHSFRDLPSGDSTVSMMRSSNIQDHSPPTKDTEVKKGKAKNMLENLITSNLSHNPNIPHSLKAIFEELKREALSVNHEI